MTQPPDYYTQTPSAPGVHDASQMAAPASPNPLTNLQLGNFVGNLIGLVVQAITGVFIPGGLKEAFAQLKNWAEVILPQWILEPLEQLLEFLVSIVGSVPIVGGVVQTLANYLGIVTGKADDAQATAGAALQSTLTGDIVDNFDRAAASNLGGAYDRSETGSGGTFGTDGLGNAKSTTSGATTTHTWLDRRTTALTTDYHVTAAVLATKPKAGGVGGTDSATRLAGRMNTAKDTYVVGIVGSGQVEIGYVLSGTYTRLGSVASVSMGSGAARWDFRAGTGSTGDDPYTFELLKDNFTVCTRTDSSHLSQLGAGYEYGALISAAGIEIISASPVQMEAPTVQALAFSARSL